MLLNGLAKKHAVKGLDPAKLVGQEDAFQTCMEFFDGVPKAPHQNRKHGSYSLKHLVENPSGTYGIESSNDCYSGFIYEGTLILGALASGFSVEQRGEHLNASVNVSNASLKRRAAEIAKQRMAKAA